MSSPNKNSKCFICGVSFSLLSKKFECFICNQNVCRSHSITNKNSPHCESCEKSFIRSQIFTEAQQNISALKSELAHLEKHKKKFQIDISTNNDSIRKLEKTIKVAQDSHSEKILVLDKKIINECEKISTDTNLAMFLEKSLNECKNNEKSIVEKLNHEVHSLILMQTELEELKSTEKSLISQIDKLNFSLRSHVPNNRVSLIACSGCKQSLKEKFSEVFDEDRSITTQNSFVNSFLTLSVSQDTTNVSHACRTCLII